MMPLWPLAVGAAGLAYTAWEYFRNREADAVEAAAEAGFDAGSAARAAEDAAEDAADAAGGLLRNPALSGLQVDRSEASLVKCVRAWLAREGIPTATPIEVGGQILVSLGKTPPQCAIDLAALRGWPINDPNANGW